MNPQSRSFLHRAQQESFKVEEDFVRSVAVPRWLMWNDRSKVAISAAIANQRNGTHRMRVIGIGAHGDFHQLHILPNALQTDAGSELKLRSDWNRLVDRHLVGRLDRVGRGVLRQVTVVPVRSVDSAERRGLFVKCHFILQSTGSFFNYTRHSRAMGAILRK